MRDLKILQHYKHVDFGLDSVGNKWTNSTHGGFKAEAINNAHTFADVVVINSLFVPTRAQLTQQE